MWSITGTEVGMAPGLVRRCLIRLPACESSRMALSRSRFRRLEGCKIRVVSDALLSRSCPLQSLHVFGPNVFQWMTVSWCLRGCGSHIRLRSSETEFDLLAGTFITIPHGRSTYSECL